MARTRRLNLAWPALGLDRRGAYQQQPPFSTPDCENVRTRGAFQRRERGGSRPGVEKAFYERLGGAGAGAAIRLLGEVETLKSDKTDLWADDFKGGSIGGVWALASWVDQTAIASIPAGTSRVVEGAGKRWAYVRDAMDSFDGAVAYQIELFITPHQGVYNGKHIIFLGMDATTPDASADGIEVVLEITGNSGAYTGYIIDMAASVPTVAYFTSGTISAAKPGWFKVLRSGTSLKVYWHGTEVFSATTAADTGARFGFGLERDAGAAVGADVRCETFRITYSRSDTREWPRRILVAAAGTEFWREGRVGVLEKITFSPAIDIEGGSLIHSAAHLQKLYIADHGAPRAAATDGVVSGTSLDSATYTDWTTLSIDVEADVVEIAGTVAGVTTGTYGIASIAAGALTMDAAAGSGSGVTFRVIRGVKVYDPADDTMVLLAATAGKGSVPVGCKVIAVYRDRLLLAGADHNPHIVYASRQGDPKDWDYGAAATDVARAWSLTNAEAGRVGERVTALLPFKDDYCVVGCENSLWLLRGDPAAGGSLDNISHTIGIIDRGAWCRTSEGAIVFLSGDGLYMLPPSGYATPESISRDRLPHELVEVDTRLYTPTMAYDVRDRGIHIFLAPVDDRPVKHYFFDWITKGFWPLTLDNDHDPTALLAYHGSHREDSAVLLGCRDGYIRRFNELAETDDGTEISSYVRYGPFQPGGTDFDEGLVTELVGKLAEESGPANWALLVGDYAEQVSRAEVSGADEEFETGRWTAGRSYAEHPRARAAFVCLQLEDSRGIEITDEDGVTLTDEAGVALLEEGSTGRGWAVEGANIAIQAAGRMRRI